jgi:hypothetical protein
MPEPTPVGKLVPGTRYRLDLDDCCVQGSLVATFSYYNLDEDGDPEEAVFDIGTMGPMWGQWTATVDA